MARHVANLAPSRLVLPVARDIIRMATRNQQMANVSTIRTDCLHMVWGALHHLVNDSTKIQPHGAVGWVSNADVLKVQGHWDLTGAQKAKGRVHQRIWYGILGSLDFDFLRNQGGFCIEPTKSWTLFAEGSLQQPSKRVETTGRNGKRLCMCEPASSIFWHDLFKRATDLRSWNHLQGGWGGGHAPPTFDVYQRVPMNYPMSFRQLTILRDGCWARLPISPSCLHPKNIRTD